MELHHEQRYVSDIAYARNIPVELKLHPQATVSCAEKAALLHWDVSRIVKALYYHTGDYANLIGIITPETGPLDSTKIFMSALHLDKKAAKRYNANGFMPSGMSKGTCTPFPKESVLQSEISHLIILDKPALDDMIVDISVGDEFPEPFKVSMHLPYRGIYEILSNRFGSDIVRRA